MTKIPADLYLRWHFLARVIFEKSILTEIPYQTIFLPPYMLSFAGNRIETIPELAMMPPGMVIPELLLKNDPLKELPAQLVGPTALIMSLNVQNTSVSSMPEWVKTQTKVIWAYDTPFCSSESRDPALAPKAMCFERPAAQESSFPMYLFEALYPFDA
ncbi:Reticulon-4-interacting protein 1 [Phytophthora cinnamomi]|uniref:Reticulon-4-interacting protein 1 n=1 Tax=Phytophthora cinnamomi TaxID=4785 RepID=UPI003559A9C5|nr:Reticulon-4-interacting protein 1 [Phytophthora cinnamomi]